MRSSLLPRMLKLSGVISQRRRYAKLQANDLEGMLHEKSKWDTFPDPIQKLAVFAEHARANNYQIPLLSKAADGGLDQSKAYHVAAAIRQLREMNGEVVAGRKIGFTNKSIWPDYRVDASNWSYIYQNTVVDLPGATELGGGKAVLANISHLSALEPKIEPELVLGLKSPVDPTMSDVELLQCIGWIAHGFEIVASIFPGWKFTAADTTAAFALHGLLLVGPRLSLNDRSQSAGALLEDLRNFTVDLHKDGKKVEEGKGSNILGSPINALRHIAELLAADEHNTPLQAGEIITTGTLTKALTIRNGDLWSTKIKGIDLPGLDVKFRMQ
ncbi:unnamed protein product [Zymoseptoria tritici ST99CH_3D7]|uniref:Fumarylacetoacetase-like C-terminal domain-containing protein n=1 Tax=Zymoseptoria tritici (strain ST99CH_3D7) TaxID=1276538 RepID=A0A1X7RGM1_ZYMT9|nr:unnamed protein product [Zymoseptoria tritici ST99CH_3D7]